MKHPFNLPVIFCLIFGIMVGGLLPMPWDEEDLPDPSTAVNSVLPPPSNDVSTSAGTSPNPASSPEPLDVQDNLLLLNTALAITQALKEQDYATVAAFVHPQRGVTFTPYSTVDFETNLTFSADQIKNLAGDGTVYTWGSLDGRDTLIELTMPQYFQQYVYDADYIQAPKIGVDQVMLSGNALENLTEAYPGCRFVDFSFPGPNPSGQGLDWRSLKLVFEAGDTNWLLVGVVHGQWTP